MLYLKSTKRIVVIREKVIDMQEIKLCECGCGQPTPIAKKTNAKLGHVIGQPVRFIRGHHNKIRPLRPAEGRYWQKVIKRGTDECWDWKGSHDQHGYGQLRIDGHNIKAHRFSYELHNGPIPDGADICHSCDHPPCTNPAHLFAGTAKDNITDAISKGRFVMPPPNQVRGETNGRAVFTNAQVAEFRRQFSTMKLSVTAFATFHDIPVMSMWNLLHYKTYKDV